MPLSDQTHFQIGVRILIITMFCKIQCMHLLQKPLDCFKSLYCTLVLFDNDCNANVPPGTQPRHSCPHRSLHVAPPLVHVGGHFRHTAPHRALPHPLRVEQPLRHDTARQEQAAHFLLLLCPQSLLCNTVWTNCRHQGKVAFLSVINRCHAGWRRGKRLGRRLGGGDALYITGKRRQMIEMAGWKKDG